MFASLNPLCIPYIGTFETTFEATFETTCETTFRTTFETNTETTKLSKGHLALVLRPRRQVGLWGKEPTVPTSTQTQT